MEPWTRTWRREREAGERREGNGIWENEPCLPLPDKLLLLLAPGYVDASLAQRYFGRYSVRVNSDFDENFHVTKISRQCTEVYKILSVERSMKHTRYA